MKYIHIPLPVYSCLLVATLLSQGMAQTTTNEPPQAGPTAPGAPPAAPFVPTEAPAVPVAPAPQRVVATPPPTQRAEQLQSFKFEQTDLDLVLTRYCEWTGQIYLKPDTLKASISVKADKLTTRESIEVIEAILAMNNIVIVPTTNEKVIKVVPANDPNIVGAGGDIIYDQEKEYAGSDKLVHQIIHLQNPATPELEKAVRQLMHAYGQYLPLETSNSLMITDTEANILRIRELIKFLDQASAGMESRIYQIEYADATEIAAKLSEIVAMAQEGKPTTTTVFGNPNARTPAGVIRARNPQTRGITQVTSTGNSGAPIIQGAVKVLPDERTNIILIFSMESNFAFFDNIINVLDIEVDPAISFEVVNLEYADAEELAGTLNELVGAAQSTQSGQSGNNRTVPSRTTTRRVSPNSQSTALKSLARLSENTKILADQRTNAILLMGQKSDIAAIKNVISGLDVMLEQVMIEAAIFEVTLGDDLEHGLQWLYKSQGLDKIGSWDGVGLVTNVAGNAAAGALAYYQNLTGLDSQLAIKLSAGDSNVKLLATPIIMTTDNTEASLSIGEQRPVVTSTDTTINSTQQRSNYEYKDIGIQLTVTPSINPQRFVVMDIVQQADQVGDEIPIDGNPVPVILNRQFEAKIAVPDRGTIALGGLINSEERDSVSKIPILGDIPLIGRYLFSSVKKENRQTELIVLMTPYVLTTNDEVLEETARRYDVIDMQQEDWQNSWSESKLRERVKPEEDQ